MVEFVSQIVACTERAIPLAGNDTDPDVRISLKGIKDLGEFVASGCMQRVHDVRPVHGDRKHVT